MRLLSLLSSLVLVGACNPFPGDSGLMEPGSFNPRKVEICHIKGNGDANIISVSSNAVDAHIRHGDHRALDHEVCEDGIDNDCNGQLDDGCAVICPCFDEADIDEAYTAWVEDSPDQENAACYDEQVGWQDGPGDYGQYDSVTLSFEALSFTPAGFEITNEVFRATVEDFTSDYERTESSTCESSLSRTTVGGDEGSGDVVYDRQIVKDVTDEAVQICQELILDQASQNEITCDSGNATE